MLFLKKHSLTPVTLIFYSLLVLISIIVLIFFSTTQPTWDEAHYQASVPKFIQYKLSAQLYQHTPGYIIGPMYLIIHTLAKPITGLEFISMRYLSLCFFLITFFGLYHCLKIINAHQSFMQTFVLLALPPLITISAIAIADIIALAFATWALFFTLKSFTISQPLNKNLIFAIILWTFTLYTRQTYLPAILALPLILIKQKKLSLHVLMLFFSTFFFFSYLIYLWQGFSPLGGKLFFHPLYLITSFAFISAFIFFIEPTWLKLSPLWLFLVSLFALPLAIIFPILHIAPLHRILANFLSTQLLFLYQCLFSFILYFLFLMLIAAIIKHFSKLKYSSFLYLYFAFSILGLTSITLFQPTHSSRYLVATIPFLILFLNNRIKINHYFFLRIIFGSIIGFLSLASYLL